MTKKRSSPRGGGRGSDEKGRGIDLLFGSTPDDDSEQPEGTSQRGILQPAGAGDVPAADEGMPYGEADLGTTATRGGLDIEGATESVDELGLPVAREAPPADAGLILDDELANLPVASETPPADIDLSLGGLDDLPVASETPPTDLELSLEDLDALPVASEAPPPSIPPAPMTPAAPAPPPVDEAPTIADPATDLSGLNNDPLANLEVDQGLPPMEVPSIPPAPVSPVTPIEPPLPPIVDIPPVDPSPLPPIVDAPLPPTSIDIPAAPISPVSPATDPTVLPPADFAPLPPTPGSTTAPAPPPSYTTPTTGPANIDPSVPPPPPSSSIGLPRSRVESITGLATERIQVVEKDILPEDTKFGAMPTTSALTLVEQGMVQTDEAITQRVSRYIGRERREKLDDEIELMYKQVARELTLAEDVNKAQMWLSEAQNIIFEDVREYDKARHRVELVRAMLTRRQNIRRWSYTWGSAVFFYAIIWLAAFFAGFLFTDAIGSALNSGNASSGRLAVQAAWFAALAGGIGGVASVLYSLYWRISFKQDFNPERTMYYVVQPILGFILGAVMYFILGSGFVAVNFVTEPTQNLDEKATQVLSSDLVIAIQIIFGFLAGFRVRFVLQLLDRVVQSFSSTPQNANSSDTPESVLPADQLIVPPASPTDRL